jgi:hypothetical protein
MGERHRILNPGPAHDPALPVPEKWTGYEFEYRHGWGWGPRPNIYCPVRIEVDDGRPRDAWKAGRAAYRKQVRALTTGDDR